MIMPESQRLRYWSYVLGLVFFIYSTLYIARPICTFLKEVTPFYLMVDGICIILLACLLFFIQIKIGIKKILTCILLGIALSGYIYGIVMIEHPEEKVHFIEYGFLAFLIFRAFLIDLPSPLAYLGTFVLVAFFGWIDEGIQYLLPNRYYQIQDVILNGVSGGLSLLLILAYRNERKI